MEDLRLWLDDPWLEPYKKVILNRYQTALIKYLDMAGYGSNLNSSVNAHLYYGVHKEKNSWAFREWAPNATSMYLIGDMNSWQIDQEYKFENIGNGNWELILSLDKANHLQNYKWYIEWPGGSGERLPAYSTRCVQDSQTNIFSAQIWDPIPYKWKYKQPSKPNSLFIYEAHIGMSGEFEGIASYEYFRINVLPKIISLGYNTIQLMAIQEHPYYGSFGYQVSNFFAASSRYGTPEELKMLIDDAHSAGISMVLDIVHSHSVNNVNEGISEFDGTDYLYFHKGERGRHPAWTSRCFDYGKDEVLKFLLSNCKYWLEEYHFDGFRFDGITSMIYFDHGLGKAFTDYSSYFDGNQDIDAIVYLTLANRLIREINSQAITIAEDVSGMPGLAAPYTSGGIGFDYRMSMGISDNWIKWIKELKDEEWNMGQIYFELTNKRADEKTVSYAECHDQAMVGDKTIIFRLIDKEMYFSMSRDIPSLLIDRGLALHKMIRLVTLATAGNGYLNFMGNEFGHPEWIDFPREGNGWSYFYARRQWTLAENENLKYKYLLDFDKAMVSLAKKEDILSTSPELIFDDNQKQILSFKRGELIFVFNFNPSVSFSDYKLKVNSGKYYTVLDSDSASFGGFERNDPNVKHFTLLSEKAHFLSLYLPSRSVLVLKREK